MTSGPKPRAGGHSLAALSGGLDRAVGPALFVAMALLAAGLTLPFFTVERFFLLEDEVSVVRSMFLLFEDGDYLLLTILFVFTIVFPFVKLILSVKLWYFTRIGPEEPGRALGWLESASRWSMLDVFVVALLVISIKTSLVAEIVVHMGLYLVTAAILISGLALHRIGHLVRKLGPIDG